MAFLTLRRQSELVRSNAARGRVASRLWSAGITTVRPSAMTRLWSALGPVSSSYTVTHPWSIRVQADPADCTEVFRRCDRSGLTIKWQIHGICLCTTPPEKEVPVTSGGEDCTTICAGCRTILSPSDPRCTECECET